MNGRLRSFNNVVGIPRSDDVCTANADAACYIICADGGANRLYDMMKSCGKESTEVLNLSSSMPTDLMD